MLKTWKVDYFPAHDKYMLDLILNEKIYPIEISKEFAKELGDSALIDSFIEQAYINENKHLKSENAALKEKLEKAVEIPDYVFECINGKVERIFTEYLTVGELKNLEANGYSLTKEAAESRLAELKGDK